MAAPGHPAVPRTAWAFLALVPVSLAGWALGIGPVPVFLLAAVAIIPLAYVMGVATEELGKHAGPGIGGLLNATFGNATELIIGLAALSSGLITVVKASITGSIIGNLLLVLGASMLAGGLRHKRQTFNRAAAWLQVTMLALAVVGLVMPALYSLSVAPASPTPPLNLERMSVIISAILLVGYFAGLLFSLYTHKDLFNPVTRETDPPHWSARRALGVLAGATALVAVESEVLVGALEGAIAQVGVTELFMGVVVVAIVGNAAEHGASILLAWRDKMDLSVGIATSSSTQVALFVAPVLVLASILLAPAGPMDLGFEAFELVSIALSVMILSIAVSDGESNWYEGALLVMVYAIVAVGFLFHP